MDVTAIRNGLAALAEDAYATALGYVPDDVVDFPAFIVGSPRLIEYGETLGTARLEIPVTVAVNAADLRAAQAELDAAAGTEADSSLPLLVNGASHESWVQARVTGAEPARYVSVGADKALAADFVVTIRTRK